MKLRIRGDSLRLRLTQGELASLAAGETVVDAIHFGVGDDDSLRCEVVIEADVAGLDAQLHGRTIRVIVPAADLIRIAANDEVGLSGTKPIGPGRALAILLEKDFRCLVPRPGEDVVDAFARPDDVPGC